MLKWIDAAVERHLERSYRKMSPGYKRLYHFFQGKWGFLIQTFFALALTCFEATEKWHEHAHAYAAIYLLVAFVLCLFVLLHFFLGRKIDGLEARLKLFEAALVLYFGVLKLHEVQETEGFHFRFYALLIATSGVVFFYVYNAHFYRLKKQGRVTWLRH